MAVNCWMTPAGMFGLAGLTAMEVSRGVTEMTMLAETFPAETYSVVFMAVMVDVPTETVVTRPLLFTVATEVSDEFQVTWVVISGRLSSE